MSPRTGASSEIRANPSSTPAAVPISIAKTLISRLKRKPCASSGVHFHRSSITDGLPATACTCAATTEATNMPISAIPAAHSRARAHRAITVRAGLGCGTERAFGFHTSGARRLVHPQPARHPGGRHAAPESARMRAAEACGRLGYEGPKAPATCVLARSPKACGTASIIGRAAHCPNPGTRRRASSHCISWLMMPTIVT